MINKQSFLDKKNVFQNDIVFIDGLWGCGKALIGPIIAGMEKVEKPTISTIFENISILLNKNKITFDAADTLFKVYLDELTYHNQLGRNINLRMHDVTGVLNNPNSIKDFKKLLIKDIDLNSNSFKETIISIMGHMVLISSDRLLNLSDKNIRFIEILRHPLYVFDHWYSFLNRFNDKKIFTLALYEKNNKIPWFAESWKEDFVNSNSYDRCLLSIIFCYELLFEKLKACSSKENFLALSFESIVYDTEDKLSVLSKFIGKPYGPSLNKTLKKQFLPRKTINSGKGYSKYGWNSGSKNEELDYKSKMKIIKDNCSIINIENFERIINDYNKHFPSILKNY
jgi:hypothetical protein